MLRLAPQLEYLQRENRLRIVLASKSPRRNEILRKNVLGDSISVVVRPSSFKEDWPKDKSPEEYTVAYAREKAKQVENQLLLEREEWSSDLLPSRTYLNVVIGCDTVVVSDSTILEKPKDKEEATKMLLSYRGKRHQVVSGVCVNISHIRAPLASNSAHDILSRSSNEFFCKTDVKFGDYGTEDVTAYVETGEPMDKAGGYGIQSLGAFLCDSINGCYFNVVGLPARKLSNTLALMLEAKIKEMPDLELPKQGPSIDKDLSSDREESCATVACQAENAREESEPEMKRPKKVSKTY